MKTTQDIRDYVESGMAEMADKFRAAGSEIYVETGAEAGETSTPKPAAAAE